MSAAGKPTVYLIDACPYVFRAWFSLPSSLTDPEGRPVNAVHGFASFLIRLIGEEKPTHLAVTFDESLTTSFRNEFYPPYKAQRELPPAELERQLDDCQELARAFGARVFSDERYEADDLIGTLCAQLLGEGCGAVVVTNDKDLGQLVGDRVELYDFARGERYGADGVVERFGVRPEQIADYLGLAGDAVDNIPGVKGVGAKSAAGLLREFADLEAIYADLEQVASLSLRGAKSIARKLEADREMAFLSRKLATIAADAPVRAIADELVFAGPERDKVETLFGRLGFERLKERVPFR